MLTIQTSSLIAFGIGMCVIDVVYDGIIRKNWGKAVSGCFTTLVTLCGVYFIAS